jgi:hypothetical protein
MFTHEYNSVMTICVHLCWTYCRLFLARIRTKDDEFAHAGAFGPYWVDLCMLNSRRLDLGLLSSGPKNDINRFPSHKIGVC